jgi:hypothetical protein
MLLDIESNLARTLSVWQDVVITIDDSTHKWTIIALSSVAGKNLLSSIRIAVIGWQNIIGKTAKIVFSPRSNPLESGVLSIPLEAVRIIAENEWEIRYLQDNNILTKTISIVAIRSGFVETSTLLDGIDEIIVTDTTNYNSEKNTLIVQ